MSPNLRGFDRSVRFALGAVLLFSAAFLFSHPLARLLAAGFGLFSVWEGFAATCPLQAHLGARTDREALSAEKTHLLGLSAVQLVVAYEWFVGGLEKIGNPEFVSGMGATLARFAKDNPHGWYRDYLTGFAASNAETLAWLVAWGEFAVGLGLAVSLVGVLYSKAQGQRRLSLWLAVSALAGGILMNANFYLAAGWTSPSTHGVNLVMFWVQAALAYVWLSTLMSAGSGRKAR